MRVKVTKDTFKYKKGETVEVSPNEGFGLIDAGFGILTKDMTETDYKVTKKGKTNGKNNHDTNRNSR